MLLAGTGPGLAEHFEHRWRPLSAGVAVPVFAFFATGVTLGGLSGLRSSFIDPVAVGVVIGLVVGKTVGIFGAAYGLARLTRAQLDEELSWFDVWGLALLGGIGFTVSLVIGELRSAPTGKETTRSRSPSSSAACSPPPWPPSCCGSATGYTDASRRRKLTMMTPTASQTSTLPRDRDFCRVWMDSGTPRSSSPISPSRPAHPSPAALASWRTVRPARSPLIKPQSC